jgi:hypothetical protein
MPRADATFYGPHKLTNAAATLFTSPAAGTKQIIRHIHLFNTDSSARTVTASIGADAVDLEILSGLSIPANSAYDFYGIIEIPASTVVQAFASVTNVVTIVVSGTTNTP